MAKKVISSSISRDLYLNTELTTPLTEQDIIINNMMEQEAYNRRMLAQMEGAVQELNQSINDVSQLGLLSVQTDFDDNDLIVNPAKRMSAVVDMQDLQRGEKYKEDIFKSYKIASSKTSLLDNVLAIYKQQGKSPDLYLDYLDKYVTAQDDSIRENIKEQAWQQLQHDLGTEGVMNIGMVTAYYNGMLDNIDLARVNIKPVVESLGEQQIKQLNDNLFDDSVLSIHNMLASNNAYTSEIKSVKDFLLNYYQMEKNLRVTNNVMQKIATYDNLTEDQLDDILDTYEEDTKYLSKYMDSDPYLAVMFKNIEDSRGDYEWFYYKDPKTGDIKPSTTVKTIFSGLAKSQMEKERPITSMPGNTETSGTSVFSIEAYIQERYKNIEKSFEPQVANSKIVFAGETASKRLSESGEDSKINITQLVNDTIMDDEAVVDYLQKVLTAADKADKELKTLNAWYKKSEDIPVYWYTYMSKKNKLHNEFISYKQGLEALYAKTGNEALKSIITNLNKKIEETNYTTFENISTSALSFLSEMGLSSLEAVGGITYAAIWSPAKYTFKIADNTFNYIASVFGYDTKIDLEHKIEQATFGNLFYTTNYIRRQVQKLRQSDSFIEGLAFDLSGGLGQMAPVFISEGTGAILKGGVKLWGSVAKVPLRFAEKIMPKVAYEAGVKYTNIASQWLAKRESNKVFKFLDKALGRPTYAGISYAIEEPVVAAYQNYPEAFNTLVGSIIDNYITDEDTKKEIVAAITERLNNDFEPDNVLTTLRALSDYQKKHPDKNSIVEQIMHDVANINEDELKDYMVYTNTLWNTLPNFIEHNLLKKLEPSDIALYKSGKVLRFLNNMIRRGTSGGTVEFMQESFTEPMAVSWAAAWASEHETEPYHFTQEHAYEGLVGFLSAFLTAGVLHGGGAKVMFTNDISDEQLSKMLEDVLNRIDKNEEATFIQELFANENQDYTSYIASLTRLIAQGKFGDKLTIDGLKKHIKEARAKLNEVEDDKTRFATMYKLDVAEEYLNSGIDKELNDIYNNKDYEPASKPFLVDMAIDAALKDAHAKASFKMHNRAMTDTFMDMLLSGKKVNNAKQLIDVVFEAFGLNEDNLNDVKIDENSAMYKALKDAGVEEDYIRKAFIIQNIFGKLKYSAKVVLIDQLLNLDESEDIDASNLKKHILNVNKLIGNTDISDLVGDEININKNEVNPELDVKQGEAETELNVSTEDIKEEVNKTKDYVKKKTKQQQKQKEDYNDVYNESDPPALKKAKIKKWQQALKTIKDPFQRNIYKANIKDAKNIAALNAIKLKTPKDAQQAIIAAQNEQLNEQNKTTKQQKPTENTVNNEKTLGDLHNDETEHVINATENAEKAQKNLKEAKKKIKTLSQKELNKDMAVFMKMLLKSGYLRDYNIDTEEVENIRKMFIKKYGEVLGEKVFNFVKDAALDSVGLSRTGIFAIIRAGVKLKKKYVAVKNGKKTYHLILKTGEKYIDIVTDKDTYEKEDLNYTKVLIESIYGDELDFEVKVLNVQSVSLKEDLKRLLDTIGLDKRKYDYLRIGSIKNSYKRKLEIQKIQKNSSRMRDVVDIKMTKTGYEVLLSDGTKRVTKLDKLSLYKYDILHGTNLSGYNKQYYNIEEDSFFDGGIYDIILSTIYNIEPNKIEHKIVRNKLSDFLLDKVAKETKNERVKIVADIIKQLGFKVYIGSKNTYVDVKNKEIYISKNVVDSYGAEYVFEHEGVHIILAYVISDMFNEDGSLNYKFRGVKKQKLLTDIMYLRRKLLDDILAKIRVKAKKTGLDTAIEEMFTAGELDAMAKIFNVDNIKQFLIVAGTTGNYNNGKTDYENIQEFIAYGLYEDYARKVENASKRSFWAKLKQFVKKILNISPDIKKFSESLVNDAIELFDESLHVNTQKLYLKTEKDLISDIQENKEAPKTLVAEDGIVTYKGEKYLVNFDKAVITEVSAGEVNVKTKDDSHEQDMYFYTEEPGYEGYYHISSNGEVNIVQDLKPFAIYDINGNKKDKLRHAVFYKAIKEDDKLILVEVPHASMSIDELANLFSTTLAESLNRFQQYVLNHKGNPYSLPEQFMLLKKYINIMRVDKFEDVNPYGVSILFDPVTGTIAVKTNFTGIDHNKTSKLSSSELLSDKLVAVLNMLKDKGVKELSIGMHPKAFEVTGDKFETDKFNDVEVSKTVTYRLNKMWYSTVIDASGKRIKPSHHVVNIASLIDFSSNVNYSKVAATMLDYFEKYNVTDKNTRDNIIDELDSYMPGFRRYYNSTHRLLIKFIKRQLTSWSRTLGVKQHIIDNNLTDLDEESVIAIYEVKINDKDYDIIISREGSVLRIYDHSIDSYVEESQIDEILSQIENVDNVEATEYYSVDPQKIYLDTEKTGDADAIEYDDGFDDQGNLFRDSEEEYYGKSINVFAKLLVLRYLKLSSRLVLVSNDYVAANVEASHFTDELVFYVNDILQKIKTIDADAIFNELQYAQSDMIRAFALDYLNGKIDKILAKHLIQKAIRMEVKYQGVLINKTGESRSITVNRDLKEEDLRIIIKNNIRLPMQHLDKNSKAITGRKSAISNVAVAFIEYSINRNNQTLKNLINKLAEALEASKVFGEVDETDIKRYVEKNVYKALNTVLGKEGVVAILMSKYVRFSKSKEKHDNKYNLDLNRTIFINDLINMFGKEFIHEKLSVEDAKSIAYKLIKNENVKDKDVKIVLSKYNIKSINDIGYLDRNKRILFLKDLEKLNGQKNLDSLITNKVIDMFESYYTEFAKDIKRTFVTGLSKMDIHVKKQFIKNKKFNYNIDNETHTELNANYNSAINTFMDNYKKSFADDITNNSGLYGIISLLALGNDVYNTNEVIVSLVDLYKDILEKHMPSSTVVQNKRIFRFANTNMLWQTFIDEETMHKRNMADIIFKDNLLYILATQYDYTPDIRQFNLSPYINQFNNTEEDKWYKLMDNDKLFVLFKHYINQGEDNEVIIGTFRYIIKNMAFHQLSDKNKLYTINTPVLPKSMFKSSYSNTEKRHKTIMRLIEHAIKPEIFRIAKEDGINSNSIFYFMPELNRLLFDDKEFRELVFSTTDETKWKQNEEVLLKALLPAVDRIILEEVEHDIQVLSQYDMSLNRDDVVEFVVNSAISLALSRRFVEGDPRHYNKKYKNSFKSADDAIEYVIKNDRNLGKRAVMFYTDGSIHLDKDRKIKVYAIPDRKLNEHISDDDAVAINFKEWLTKIFGEDNKQVEKLYGEYMEQDIADGISYTTWQVWLDITAQRTGMQEDEYETLKNIFIKLDNGEELTATEKETFDHVLMQNIKEIIAWFDDGGNPVFLKTSTLPLNRQLAKSLGLEKLYDQMYNDYKDGKALPFVGHMSALKVFHGDVAEFNTETGDVDKLKEPVVVTTTGMRIVLNKPSSFEHEGRATIRLSSQFMRMATGFLDENDKLKYNGKTLTYDDIIRKFNSLVAEVVKAQAEAGLYKTFGKTDIDKQDVLNRIDQLVSSEEDMSVNDVTNPVLSNLALIWFTKLGAFIRDNVLHTTVSGKQYILASMEKLALINNYSEYDNDGSIKIRNKYRDADVSADDVIIGPKVKLANGKIISLIDDKGNIIEENVELIENMFAVRIPYSGHMSSHRQRIVGIDTSISTGDVVYVHPLSNARLGDDFDIDVRFTMMHNLLEYTGKDNQKRLATVRSLYELYKTMSEYEKSSILAEIGLSEHDLIRFAKEDELLDFIHVMFRSTSMHENISKDTDILSLARNAATRIDTSKDEWRVSEYGRKHTFKSTITPGYNIAKSGAGSFGKESIGYYATSLSFMYILSSTESSKKQEYKKKFGGKLKELTIKDGENIHKVVLDPMRLKAQIKGDEPHAIGMRRENDATDNEKIGVLWPLGIDKQTIVLDIMFMFYGIDVVNEKHNASLVDLINLSSAADEWRKMASESKILNKKQALNKELLDENKPLILDYNNLYEHVKNGKQLSKENRDTILYLYHHAKEINDEFVKLFILSNPMTLSSFGIKEFVTYRNLINEFLRRHGQINSDITTWIFYNVLFTTEPNEAVDNTVKCCGLYARTPETMMTLMALNLGNTMFDVSPMFSKIIRIVRNEKDIKAIFDKIRQAGFEAIKTSLLDGSGEKIDAYSIYRQLTAKNNKAAKFFKQYVIVENNTFMIRYDFVTGDSLQDIKKEFNEALNSLDEEMRKKVAAVTLNMDKGFAIVSDKYVLPMLSIFSINDMKNNGIISEDVINKVLNNIDIYIEVVKNKAINVAFADGVTMLSGNPMPEPDYLGEYEPFVKAKIKGKEHIYMYSETMNKYVDITNVKDTRVLRLLAMGNDITMTIDELNMYLCCIDRSAIYKNVEVHINNGNTAFSVTTGNKIKITINTTATTDDINNLIENINATIRKDNDQIAGIIMDKLNNMSISDIAKKYNVEQSTVEATIKHLKNITVDEVNGLMTIFDKNC